MCQKNKLQNYSLQTFIESNFFLPKQNETKIYDFIIFFTTKKKEKISFSLNDLMIIVFNQFFFVDKNKNYDFFFA